MALSRKWKIILISVATPVVLAVGYCFYLDFASKAELEKAHKRLRAAGMSVTVEELAAKFPAVADEENAAVAMSKVGALPELERNVFITITTPVGDLSRSEKDYDKYIAVVDEVLSKPKVNFSKYWSFRYDEETSIDAWAIGLSKALLGKARLEYLRGNRVDALNLILKIVKLANLQLENPSVFSLIRAVWMEKLSLQFLRSFSDRKYRNDEMDVIHSIQNSMKEPKRFSYYFSEMPIRAQQAYKAIEEDVSVNRHGSNWPLTLKYKITPPSQKRMLTASLLNELSEFAECGNSTEGSYEVMKTELQKLDRKFMSGNESDINTGVKPYFLLSCAGLADWYMEMQMYQDLLSSALGKYKGTDPFDSKPYKITRLPKYDLIYSVGKNLVDDGGDEKKDIGLPIFSTLR